MPFGELLDLIAWDQIMTQEFTLKTKPRANKPTGRAETLLDLRKYR